MYLFILTPNLAESISDGGAPPWLGVGVVLHAVRRQDVQEGRLQLRALGPAEAPALPVLLASLARFAIMASHASSKSR